MIEERKPNIVLNLPNPDELFFQYTPRVYALWVYRTPLRAYKFTNFLIAGLSQVQCVQKSAENYF